MSQDPLADAAIISSEAVELHARGQEERIREIVREEVARILDSVARSGRKQEIPSSKRSWDQGFGVAPGSVPAPLEGCAWHGPDQCPNFKKPQNLKGGPC